MNREIGSLFFWNSYSSWSLGKLPDPMPTKDSLYPPDNSPPKIEDLSSLNPEDIKRQYTHFLEQDGMEYRVGQGLLDHRLRHDI